MKCVKIVGRHETRRSARDVLKLDVCPHTCQLFVPKLENRQRRKALNHTSHHEKLLKVTHKNGKMIQKQKKPPQAVQKMSYAQNTLRNAAKGEAALRSSF